MLSISSSSFINMYNIKWFIQKNVNFCGLRKLRIRLRNLRKSEIIVLSTCGHRNSNCQSLHSHTGPTDSNCQSLFFILGTKWRHQHTLRHVPGGKRPLVYNSRSVTQSFAKNWGARPLAQSPCDIKLSISMCP